jgi:hypothetical protein
MIPLPLAAGYGVTHPSKSRIIALVAMYIVGVVLMLGSDYQKNTILRKRKGTSLSIVRINFRWILQIHKKS